VVCRRCGEEREDVLSCWAEQCAMSVGEGGSTGTRETTSYSTWQRKRAWPYGGVW
jgi:uncharacterized membrane protein YvbJ